MEATDIKLFEAKTLTSQYSLFYKEENISKNGLVSQSLICLSELNQGWSIYEQYLPKSFFKNVSCVSKERIIYRIPVVAEKEPLGTKPRPVGM